MSLVEFPRGGCVARGQECQGLLINAASIFPPLSFLFFSLSFHATRTIGRDGTEALEFQFVLFSGAGISYIYIYNKRTIAARKENARKSACGYSLSVIDIYTLARKQGSIRVYI